VETTTLYNAIKARQFPTTVPLETTAPPQSPHPQPSTTAREAISETDLDIFVVEIGNWLGWMML
jgi:hypothetical protein